MKVKRIFGALMAIVFAFSICASTPGAVRKAYAAYENTHSNTGNQREDIVAVAETQIGYHEGANNETKYNHWLGSIGGYPANGYGYPWCHAFVSWCANQAGISSDIVPYTAGTAVGQSFFVNDDVALWEVSAAYGGGYTPQRGDIIYFGSGSSPSHVGIVTGCDGSTVYTVEGNSSDQVIERSYNLNNSYIIGYGVPNYKNSTPPNDDVPQVPLVIEDMWVNEVSDIGYTAWCKVNRTDIVSKVLFPTWTGDEQDDIIWHEGTYYGDNQYYCYVRTNEHNDEKNIWYHTHVYAYDNKGNYDFQIAGDVYIDDSALIIEDMWVNEVSDIGYTAWCKVNRTDIVSKVLFPTWTGDEQDDIIWHEGKYYGDNQYYCYVRTNEHNDEKNIWYHTHVYAYDNKENYDFQIAGDVYISEAVSPGAEQTIQGDCNNDGEFTVTDVVLLQKWLLAVPDTHLTNWQAADLCEDGKLDVFDLILMKKKLVS